MRRAHRARAAPLRQVSVRWRPRGAAPCAHPARREEGLGPLAGVRPSRHRRAPRDVASQPGRSSWSELAIRRDNRGRQALESALDQTLDESDLLRALEAIRQGGDPGSVDALRVLCAKAPRLSTAASDGIVETARA